jgi:PBP1b-binding outer membrane lipoprotein LpoB
MRRAAGLLLLAILLAGCGQSNDQRSMNHKFQKLDYEIATLETVTSSFNAQNFARLTRRYIALTREYADQLGTAEVKRRLVDKADELDSYCLPCTGALYDEAGKY